MTEAEQIMKRCQAGTRNYEEANNLHAACYGMIGKLLAQPEQEPVAWAVYCDGFIALPSFDSELEARQEMQRRNRKFPHNKREVKALYDTPPQRTEQEPVAWRTFDGEGQYEYRAYEENESYADGWNKRNPNHKGWVEPLYTHSQRTWVGLTDEDIDHIYTGIRAVHHDVDSYVFCRAVEAKLKDKNS